MAHAPPRPLSADCRVTAVTPPGKGGIAVLTLTGPGAAEVARRILHPDGTPTSRAADGPDSERPHLPLRLGRLVLAHVMDAGERIDEVLVSPTEEGIELNCHGGPVVVRSILQLLARCGAVVEADAPAADPLLPDAHPRWDNPAIGRELKEVLPLARTPLAAAVMTTQWSAGISLLARRPAEAMAGLGPTAPPEFLRQPYLWAAGRLEISRRLLHPPEVVLIGPPNAGKSTLANALTGQAGSIVHPTPGTTRDWVREPAVLRGRPIWLTDTAGIWHQAEGVDAEAVRRARCRAQAADLVIMLTPSAEGHPADRSDRKQRSSPNRPPSAEDRPHWLAPGRPLLRVVSQVDRLCQRPANPAELPAVCDAAVSAHTGQGMDLLIERILRTLDLWDLDPSLPRAFTDRQANLLARMHDAARPGGAESLDELAGRLLAGPGR